MSVQALAWVFENSSTTGTDRLVLMSLANHAGQLTSSGYFESWPGVHRITFEAGLTRTRTTQEALARLEQRGHIERVVNGAPDQRIRSDKRPNLYRICTGGVSAERTPLPADGVTAQHTAGCRPSAPRGDAPAARGVQPGVTQTINEPSSQPSVEPREPEQQTVVAFDPEPDRFGDFWKAYPSSAGKQPAIKAWAKAMAAGHSAHELIMAAARYAQDPNRDPSYTMHAATWLNQARWDDPPLPPRNGNGARRAARPGRNDGTTTSRRVAL